MSRIVESLYSKYDLKEYYKNNFDYLEFEKYIPHCMRYKEVNIEDDGETLYWITQEPFDEIDLFHFEDALEDFSRGTNIKKAYVVLRDDSSYNYEKDKKNGSGVFVEI